MASARWQARSATSPTVPNLDTVEGEVHGRFFGKSHSGDVGYQMDGVINIPILKDHIAFRSATGYYFDPGFIDYPLLVQTPGVSRPQPSGPVSVTPAAYAANLHPAQRPELRERPSPRATSCCFR